MIKRRTLYLRFLLISLFVMCGISAKVVGQKSQVNAAAAKAWPQFWTAFRTAVKKRDRAALRGMISPDFSTAFDQPESWFHSPDDVIKWIDQMKLWSELVHSLASGSRIDRGDRPVRCTKNGSWCFKFGTDGRWRLIERGGE